MQTIECLKTRRSIRKYKKESIPMDIINKILDLATYSPSGCNCQNWEFIVVKDKTKLKEISEVHKYGGFIKDCDTAIVVCFDKNKVKFSPSQDLLSSALASYSILLSAHNLGIGACWVFIQDRDDKNPEILIKKLLSIPDNYAVLNVIPMGYPDESPSEKSVVSFNEITHFEKF